MPPDPSNHTTESRRLSISFISLMEPEGLDSPPFWRGKMQELCLLLKAPINSTSGLVLNGQLVNRYRRPRLQPHYGIILDRQTPYCGADDSTCETSSNPATLTSTFASSQIHSFQDLVRTSATSLGQQTLSWQLPPCPIARKVHLARTRVL